MREDYRLLRTDLRLFDGAAGGGAAGAGAGDGGAGEAGAAQGETQAGPAPTRRGKSGETKEQPVVYGKQPNAAAGAPDAGESTEPDVQTTSDTEEARQKAYRDLINGEYKDLYTQDTQRLIDRRFKETKNLQEQLSRERPVIDMLLQRYGIQDGDLTKLEQALDNDQAYWMEAAEEAGMTVDQYKQFQRLQRENAALLRDQQKAQEDAQVQQKLQQWIAEGEALKQRYPDFDLQTEAGNPQFVALLKSGVPVEHAYKVVHMDDIVNTAILTTAAQAEKKTADNIRARGQRPAENGVSSQSAFTVKDDVSKLTKKDRAEIAKRVARGETITF